MKDLVAVVADADYEQVLRALLGERAEALGIRRPTFDVVREVNRDSGCWRRASDFLTGYHESHRHALVMFDRAFDGAPPADRLYQDVRDGLAAWESRAEVVVVDPEIEVWAFGAGLMHVETLLGWSVDTLRPGLSEVGLWGATTKPRDPKSALQWAARKHRVHLNPRWFSNLAARASTRGCTDPAFERLGTALRRWFPLPTGAGVTLGDRPPRARSSG